MAFDQTMLQSRAAAFRGLHRKGEPFVLPNVWDVQSALLAQAAGVQALGTSSWAVAENLGFEDGETIPFDDLMTVVSGLARTIVLPVSVDMERGYAASLGQLRDNTRRLVEAGVIGINLEDGLPGDGLRDAHEQAGRIAAVKEAAGELGVDLFVNARTDVFFVHGESETAADLALDRARAYGDAGASGLFLPGLGDVTLIRRLCEEIDLPVNIMVGLGRDKAEFGRLGVSRLSLGPALFLAARAAAAEIIGQEVRGCEEK